MFNKSYITGADKVYFVTSEPGEDVDMALNSMFKFMAAQENDTVREKIIR